MILCPYCSEELKINSEYDSSIITCSNCEIDIDYMWLISKISKKVEVTDDNFEELVNFYLPTARYDKNNEDHINKLKEILKAYLNGRERINKAEIDTDVVRGRKLTNQELLSIMIQDVSFNSEKLNKAIEKYVKWK